MAKRIVFASGGGGGGGGGMLGRRSNDHHHLEPNEAKEDTTSYTEDRSILKYESTSRKR